MATIINASNSTGLTISSDLSGVLQLQQNGVALPALSVAPAFSAYNSSATSVPNTTITKIAFQTEEFDTANCFDSTTNYRFTPNVAGYYQFNLSCQVASPATNVYVLLYKNGSAFKTAGTQAGNGAYLYGSNFSTLVYMNGSTDYVEGYVFQGSGGSLNTATGILYTYFQGFLARGA